MELVIVQKDYLEELVVEYFSDIRNVFYIGCGVDYNVFFEVVLKLKEISYIQVEGFVVGELKYGIIVLIEEGIFVIGIISEEVIGVYI